MKRFSSILFILALLSEGCQDKADLLYRDTLTPLELNVSVEGNIYTRSTSTLASGSIGIYLLADNNYAEGLYLYSAISGKWTTGKPLMLNGNNASVCVWYPYNYRIPANLSELKTFPLNAQKYTPDTDLCYQTITGRVNNRNYRLQAQLQHAYSQIEFRLSRDITFKTAGSVDSITLSAPGLFKGMQLDITSGTTANGVTGNVTYIANVTIPASGEVVTAVLLPPATLTGDLKLVFRVDGKNMTATLPLSSLSKLVAGTKYTVRGVLQRKLNITVTVSPVEGTSGGEIVW